MALSPTINYISCALSAPRSAGFKARPAMSGQVKTILRGNIMTDVYAAPESELERQVTPGSTGSVEKAIRGEYEFSIGATVKEAWERTRGVKGTFFLAIIVYAIAAGAIAVIFRLLGMDPATLGPHAPPGRIIGYSVIRELVSLVVLLPLGMGLFMMGLRRSMDAPVPLKRLFGYFGQLPKMLVTMLLMYILIFIGFLLLVLPGIYLSVAYYQAIPLAVEKGLSPWAAMETARKAVTRRWFAVFGFYLVLGLINVLAVIPLGIGLIWSLPLTMIAMGVLYRNMYGCEPETLAD